MPKYFEVTLNIFCACEKSWNLDWSIQISFYESFNVFLDWGNKTKLVPASFFYFQSFMNKKNYLTKLLLQLNCYNLIRSKANETSSGVLFTLLFLKNDKNFKLGEFKNTNTRNSNTRKALQLMYTQPVRICRGRSASCFIYYFVFQVISEKKLCSKVFYQQFERYFCLKIIVAVISTNLNTHLFLFFFRRGWWFGNKK